MSESKNKKYYPTIRQSRNVRLQDTIEQDKLHKQDSDKLDASETRKWLNAAANEMDKIWNGK